MFNEKKSKIHFIVEILVELDYYVGVWVRVKVFNATFNNITVISRQ
jgi:hypothetical protein